MTTMAAKKKSGFKTYLRLLKYLKPLALPFVVSIIGFAVFAATQPMLAKLLEAVIEAINAKDSGARWILPMVAIGIFVIRGIGSFFGNYYNAFVAARLVANLRIEMFNHLVTLPASYFDDHRDSELFQRLTGSVNLISQAVTDALKTIIREGFTIAFLLAYIFYLNWKLSLTFLVIAPFLIMIVGYTARRFREMTRKGEGISASIVQSISEVLSGYQVMRIFGGEDYEVNRHLGAAERSFNNAMKIRKVSSLATPVVQLLVAVALAIIIFLLLQPETLEQYSAGELIGYLTAVGLLPKSMRQLSGLNIIMQRGITGADLIFEFLDSRPESDCGTHVCERVKGEIAFNDVTFAYKPGDHVVLDHISFVVTPGDMVALVGKSGSGKSTIAALTQRFYDVNGGSISIDGVDIREYSLKNLRQQVAFVGQNLVLFNDTIRNNIAYGSMREATDAQIVDAARKAHALEFIEKLPQGFDTMIGDNGLQLSGGQRQRIAIARAFLKDAPILILDEATSALDNESEQKIQLALNDIMKGRTTLVIAHRLSTVEDADKILVMSQGKIVEEGDHPALLKSGGIYANLYQSKEL